MGQATEYVKFRHKKAGWVVEVNADMLDALEDYRQMSDYEDLPATAGIYFKPEWHENFDNLIGA